MNIHKKTGRNLVDREQLLVDVLEYRDQLLEENARLYEALEWAMPYAERAHEDQHPGETFEKDGYVAASVARARAILEKARKERR